MTFVIFKAAGMAAAGKDETVRLGFGADEHGSEVCCIVIDDALCGHQR
jgi:hypothetical protein